MPGRQVAHATAPAQADLTAAPPAGETAPYRILAQGDLGGMGQGEVLSERDGAALIGYSGKDERDAAVLAMGSADFAVPDTAFSAATGASAPFADALIDDAHALAAPAAPASAYDVAIVDTAVSGEVAASISVLGEGSTHATGHGDATLEAIKSEFPAARILAIEALDGSGTGSSASVYAAMMAAIEAGPKVIALPLSARALAGNAAVEEAVLQAHAAGIIVVGAAGNDAADARWFVPGGIAAIVVAGACDAEGSVLVSSNRGATVDAYVPSPSTSHAAAVMAGYLAFRSSFESLEADIADAIARGKFFAYAPPEPIGIERMGILSMLSVCWLD